MKILSTIILAAAAFLATVSPVKADFIATADLTPGADNATNSQGSGSITLDYNSTADLFTYTLSWADLTGDATAAHIHFGAVGVDGPIIVPFFTTPLPGTDTISGTLTNADVTGADGITTIAEVATAIMDGNAYANVHTTAYPAGELRGQLAIAPEPGTAGLLIASLAGVFLAARRHRRSI
ncbi:MAG TPA: CHRD domain-containing protein [Bryobacteraceae bacterium]|nr:CHRD domain-containing protein [Bryobacteraceae bacterium]